MKQCIYFLIVLMAFSCKKNANDLPQTEAIPEGEMIPQYLLSTTKICIFGAVVPGKVDSKGALVTAPVGFAFNLGTATPSTFFKAIADRRAATAGFGQFYCLGNTHPSYANTIKVLNKMGALGKLTQLASGKKVATVTPASWWSATGGVYKPKQTAYSTGTKFPSKAAALGYKDATGKTFTVYFTFGTIFTSYTYPRFSSSSQVATTEAFASDSEFKVVNGNAAGRGKRWFDSCNPGADFSSGSYDALTEIPGTSSTTVGGTSFTSFSSALYDDVSAYCSL
jgi:hypothetical protein